MQVLRTSHMYLSAPMHVEDQPKFLNAAALVGTDLDPHALLAHCKDIERNAGRSAGGQRWGPRPLDLDIIFYNSFRCNTEQLTVPHPRWHERPFVSVPVSDLQSGLDVAAELKVWQVGNLSELHDSCRCSAESQPY
jgi:2-amino-4-hydroxy-6-hydroxymethyldihydropteridine diphosphokinase / dihydropteroate synthase